MYEGALEEGLRGDGTWFWRALAGGQWHTNEPRET